ncbi:HAD family hydrolase [Henriciella aquimarina]|uniref:HAD family hydrolase n=1 Tax=Henriciella aquimarina TaxID=545261 RepID=UPI000A02A980|nr:HAD-IB family phosphatase [Henriciella aquimarina]
MAGTAIFDLDRTLTRKPTWMRFVFRFNRHRPLFWAQAPWLAVCAGAHKLGLIDRTGIKNRFLATLGWADRDRVETAGRAFAEREAETGLRAGVKALIERHREDGDRLYLATAASDFIATPLSDMLGLDGVICTQTDWPEDRKRGPRVAGRNCYGPEKARRVNEALEDAQVSRPMTVYSDHVSDLQLLLLADTGVAANPSAKLHRQARQHGLVIMNLDLNEGAPATSRAGREVSN